MQTMDSDFMDAFAADYRDEIHVKAIVGGAEYTSENGTIVDMELTETLGDDDTLPIGQSGSAQLKLSLSGVSPDGLDDVTVKPYVQIGSSKWCPLGVFRVEEITSSDNYETIELDCYDSMYYADKIPYDSNLKFPAKLSDVLHELYTRTGLLIVNENVIPGYTVPKEPTDVSCRQMYAYVAGLAGGNARMTRDGKVEIVLYSPSSAVAIAGADQYDDGGQLSHNSPLSIVGLNVTCGDETWQFSGGSTEPAAVFDASAAQDRSVLLRVYANDDGTYNAEVTGTGAMKDWSSRSTVPWAEYVPNIASISFGSGVTSIGAYTMDMSGASNCPLSSILMADTVKKIGDYAFYLSRKLTSVRIGDGVEEIGRNAFSYGAILNAVSFPGSLQKIGKSAFASCSLLGKTGAAAEISGCSEIGDYAFQGCTSLSSVSLGAAEKIGVAAFMNVPIKKAELSGCTAIGDNAFSGTKLTSVSLSSAVTIGGRAFSITTLKSLSLGSSVESIGYYCIAGSQVATLSIPNTIKQIAFNAFTGSALKSIAIAKKKDSIADAPWGAASAQVIWTGGDEDV